MISNDTIPSAIDNLPLYQRNIGNVINLRRFLRHQIKIFTLLYITLFIIITLVLIHNGHKTKEIHKRYLRIICKFGQLENNLCVHITRT
jgi:hypothetical protein